MLNKKPLLIGLVFLLLISFTSAYGVNETWDAGTFSLTTSDTANYGYRFTISGGVDKVLAEVQKTPSTNADTINLYDYNSGTPIFIVNSTISGNTAVFSEVLDNTKTYVITASKSSGGSFLKNYKGGFSSPNTQGNISVTAIATNNSGGWTWSSPNFASIKEFTLSDVPPSVEDILRIEGKDIDSSLDLTNMNVTWNGTNYGNATGNIVSINITAGGGNISLPQNFTVSSINYTDVNVTNWNVSNTYLANLTGLPLEDFVILTPNYTETNQTSFNITWTQAVSPTNKTVTYYANISYVINGTIIDSFSTTNLSYLLDISNFPPSNYSLNMTATENSTGLSFNQSNFLFVNTLNYLYFYDEITTLPIPNANITIQLPLDPTNLSLVTDSLGKVFFESYINDVLQTGEYNITFEDLSGYVTPLTFSRNYSTLPVNESFNISTTSITIPIYYRSNFSAFLREATVIIEGLTNFTTSTGIIAIQNQSIVAGDYRITVSSAGFFNEEKTFTFSGQDSLNISLYMLELNSSNSGTVTIRTIDDFSRLLPNSQVNLLEYDTSTLSYLEVSECYTDSNGECKFLVETNTKSYKFTASKTVNGNTVTASTDPQIFEDSIVGGETVVFSEETITLTLSATEQFTLSPLQNIQFSITPYAESFNNVTNQSNIAVSFNSIDGQSITVCVEYFFLAGGVKTSLTGDTFCLSGSSGQVTENAFFTLNRSKDYVADIYLKTSNGNFNLDSYRYYSSVSFLENLENNAMLPYFVIFIWIFLIGGSMMLKNISLSGVGIIVGAWAIVFFFPSAILVSVAVLQTVLGVNLIYLGRKREDFG